MSYKANLPFNVPAYLLIPQTKTVQGVPTKAYPEPKDGILIYISFRTFGGSEGNTNGQYTVIDTGNVETWYRPDIKADCHLVLAHELTKVYEILGTPENIEMRNQYLKFKVQAIGGGA